jgi:hypothetical protein
MNTFRWLEDQSKNDQELTFSELMTNTDGIKFAKLVYSGENVLRADDLCLLPLQDTSLQTPVLTPVLLDGFTPDKELRNGQVSMFGNFITE